MPRAAEVVELAAAAALQEVLVLMVLVPGVEEACATAS